MKKSEVTVAATLKLDTSIVSVQGEDVLHFELKAPLDARVRCGGYLPAIQLLVKDSEDQDKLDFSGYVNLELTNADFQIICDNGKGADKMECGKEGLFFKMEERRSRTPRIRRRPIVVVPKA